MSAAVAQAQRLDVLGAPLDGVDFSPASTLREIAQNVRTILATAVGSVPLDRAFGASADLLDDPQPLAQARLVSEIVAAVERYEPRARVVAVRWERPAVSTATADGVLWPRVTIEIREGVL